MAASRIVAVLVAVAVPAAAISLNKVVSASGAESESAAALALASEKKDKKDAARVAAKKDTFRAAASAEKDTARLEHWAEKKLETWAEKDTARLENWAEKKLETWAEKDTARLENWAEKKVVADLWADLSKQGIEVFKNGRVYSGSSTENAEGTNTLTDAEMEDGDQITSTYSPQMREVLHASKYEKEFTIELNMTRAYLEKMQVGVALDLDEDYNPVSVLSIKKTGLLESWNTDHPDNQVLVGDEIVKVNDISWHHNSQNFVERIKGQFEASRRQIAGTKAVMTWAIQRPRRWVHKRFASQREDRHQQLYKLEFAAEIPITGVSVRDPLHQAMGWSLNSSVDWMPVSIEKLRNKGLIAEYNKAHPDNKIVSGDEILSVNGHAWHHSSKAFEERLETQFMLKRRAAFLSTSKGQPETLVLQLRRPREVNDRPDDAVYTRQFLVELPLKDAHPLGWRLNCSSDADPIVVDKVRPASPLEDFNKDNPTKAVQVGDTVLRVGNFLWHANSKKFTDRIEKEFQKIRPRKGQNATGSMQLLMQRRLVMPIEKEWKVTLPAVEGQQLGWQLNVTDDAFPVTVSKVRNLGVVFEYNQENPGTQIKSGDIIVKVHDVLWHQDSTAFEKRLNQLYSKCKKFGNITFFLRRPAGIVQPEAEDQSSKPFSREFIVHLQVPKDGNMGWQLNSDNETAPVTIAKVRSVGAVGLWNQEHAWNDIQGNDKIARVNNILFRGSAKQFMERLNLNIALAKTGRTKPEVSLLLQRPWRQMIQQETGEDDNNAGDDDVAGGGDDEIGAQD